MGRLRVGSDLRARLRSSRSFRAAWLTPLACLAAACFGEEEPDGGELGAGGSAAPGQGEAGTESSGGGTTSAGGGGADGLSGVDREMLAAHNAVRSALEPPLPEVLWSPTLSDFAREWAEELAAECDGISHRNQNLYGENIAMRGSSRLTEAFSPAEAVSGWAQEAECWDFGTIRGTESCDASCVSALNSSGCGHYTQLVWRNTQRVGCGYATCENGFDYAIWVCNYDPPGNFIGQTPY